jgi:hypothetical protein
LCTELDGCITAGYHKIWKDQEQALEIAGCMGVRHWWKGFSSTPEAMDSKDDEYIARRVIMSHVGPRPRGEVLFEWKLGIVDCVERGLGSKTRFSSTYREAKAWVRGSLH